VRVPLGTRVVHAYVVEEARDVTSVAPNIRAIIGKSEGPPAFDATGLALARIMAETTVCSLGEALGAVVLGGAQPRTIDRLVPRTRPQAGRLPSVPERLIAFLWEDFPDGVPVEAFLRHPETRRIGDRKTVLAHLGALIRGDYLERVRTFAKARVGAATVRMLTRGEGAANGPKARALCDLVAEHGELRRSEAVLAGYSDAVIRRAIALGALVETQQVIGAARRARSVLPALEPTAEQRDAIARIGELLAAGTFGQLLLHGITGSGKTYVYLAAIAQIVAAGGRAIVLVPEIALTPQTARRFEDVFGQNVAVLHSALSERERYDAWQAAARGDVAIVVGARSAVFAPLADVRLIVVDEAHESSYKQDTVPRYHAVEMARERMRRTGGVVVLGSATPALEDYARARAGRFPLMHLRHRATAQPLPQTRIIDLGAEFSAGNRRMFSTALLEAVEVRLQRREKTILFVNRRGSARFVLCRACGFVPTCTRCSTSLVVHRADGVLRCHYCDAQEAIPEACSQCGDSSIREFGAGSERVAREIGEFFPHAHVVRMDSDTTTRLGEHARLLDRFGREGDVLVGTQMVAKGLDFASVTLVGVIAADLDLHIADFRAAERTFDLLAQVSGRSGRASAGEALIQTYSPGNPTIRFAAAHDYEGFAQAELAERRALHWPPYVRLVYVGVIGRDRARVEATIARYAEVLHGDERWQVLGPVAYPIAKLNEEWRYRLAIKTRDIAAVRAVLRKRILPEAHTERHVRLTINVDP
jgi:primosomal protein N' (replication factor Y)